MGLIARELEGAGISTVSLSLAKEITQGVGVPRALFLKWPLGRPLGEAHAPEQQRTVLFDALSLLCNATEPNLISEPGYAWRRHKYSEPDWSKLNATVDPATQPPNVENR